MSNRENELRLLVQNYLRKGREKGFSNEDLYMAVFETVHSGEDSFIPISTIQKLSEKQYCKLFKRILIKNVIDIRSLPRDEILETGIKIMYLIYEENYFDIDSFVNNVKSELNIEGGFKSIRAKILGTSPYRGLSCILGIYLEDIKKYWIDKNLERRLAVLEEIQAKVYSEMLEIGAEH